jgi:hypothetical protein
MKKDDIKTLGDEVDRAINAAIDSKVTPQLEKVTARFDRLDGDMADVKDDVSKILDILTKPGQKPQP